MHYQLLNLFPSEDVSKVQKLEFLRFLVKTTQAKRNYETAVRRNTQK